MDGGDPLVPGRSWAEIAEIVGDIHARWRPDCRSVPQVVPVEEFAQFPLLKWYGVEFDVVSSIESSTAALLHYDDQHCGLALMVSERIYTRALEGDGFARFTLGHEVGHAVLHSEYVLRSRASGKALRRVEKRSIAPWCNAERQADVFATHFLMPTGAVLCAIDQIGTDADALAELFGVSRRAMEIRIGEVTRARST